MNQVDKLYEIVNLHAGTGNSTWIFEAVKKNSNCRILVSHNQLAKVREKDFIKWFVSKNNRQPNWDEMPHFCAIGGLMHHTYRGLRTPLIIDNSCLDVSELEAMKASLKADARYEAMSEFEVEMRKVISKKVSIEQELSKIPRWIRYIFK